VRRNKFRVCYSNNGKLVCQKKILTNKNKKFSEAEGKLMTDELMQEIINEKPGG